MITQKSLPLYLSALVLVFASCCTTRPSASPEHVVPGDESRGNTEQPVVSETQVVQAVVNKTYEDVVLGLINGAEQKIRVVHFECNHDGTINNIIAALKEAAQRGVSVQVLLEGDVDDNVARVEELTAAGIIAKLDGDKRYTHAKLIIVDGLHTLLGSTNWSYKSIRYNNETNLLLTSASVGAWFEAYAEALWANGDLSPDLEPVSDVDHGLVRTLHDGDYVEAITPLLQDAKERISLVVYGMNINPDYPDSDIYKLAAHLAAAKKRGVSVRIILEASDYNDMLNEVNQRSADYLGQSCIEVRFEPLDVITHAKLLVVDNVAVVGSNNWGHGGFELYHEVGAITDSPVVVDSLHAYFEGIWNESTAASTRCTTDP
jgi:phosphatidylserine/phosphatidylglycerophosphate/cardiolipin synthase-like enzyme